MKMLLLPILLLLCLQEAGAQTRFRHILITNDDGIEDADRLLALAKSVKNAADRVSIVVSAFDRSGTSNHSAIGKYQSTYEVTCRYRDPENAITAYSVPANPADCVILGLCGFFGDDRPDLVLSGINGGSNIGPDWFGSGTVGAARTAAFYGVPSVAFSGFNDDDPESLLIIPSWIRFFISSGFINTLGKNRYLTVAFPDVPTDRMKKAVLSKRRISFDRPGSVRLRKLDGDDPHTVKNRTIWSLEYPADLNDSGVITDEEMLGQGHIVITPMTIDENDDALAEQLAEKMDLIPKPLE
jgi:5'-nucleotidase